jgi:threonine dehydratase
MIATPTFADIEAAAGRIRPYAIRTPLVESWVLNAQTGARVFLKLETLQRTGSFKFRGACNRLSMIPEEDRANGVVAFSSGNHAQGVAAAAQIFGMPAVIVMPSDAPAPKIAGTRAFGATVVKYDRVKDDREAIAARICAERGAVLVKPYDDAGIVAGQGTVGLEIALAEKHLGIALDEVLVPCSGGGLVSGTALGLKGAGSSARVHSVEPDDFAGMKLSLEEGRRATAQGGALSIADALMAPTPGVITFETGKNILAPGLSVSDAELETAMGFAALKLKLLVEPGGAAGLAALLAGKLDVKGKTVALVLSGGNGDPAAIARFLAS